MGAIVGAHYAAGFSPARLAEIATGVGTIGAFVRILPRLLYLAVGDGIVRTLYERPTQLRRFPDGIDGEAIYQKRVPQQRPDWIDTARVTFPSGRHADELCVTELAQVVWAANLAVVDFHPWPSRRAHVDHPDELRIDVDPQPGTTFADGKRVASLVREVLDEIGYTGWPKTSGNRGIHIACRIEPEWEFRTVRRCALAFAREVERRLPELVTTAWWKEERGERVFIDYNQNARDRTIAGAYSVRPTPEATVSTPLKWKEVEDCDPRDFTLVTVPTRFRKIGDPHRAIDRRSCSLEPVLELRLHELLGGFEAGGAHVGLESRGTKLLGGELLFDLAQPLTQVLPEVFQRVELAHGLGELIVEGWKFLRLDLFEEDGERDVPGKIPFSLWEALGELENRPRLVPFDLGVEAGGALVRSQLVEQIGGPGPLDRLIVLVPLEVDQHEVPPTGLARDGLELGEAIPQPVELLVYLDLGNLGSRSLHLDPRRVRKIDLGTDVHRRLEPQGCPRLEVDDVYLGRGDGLQFLRLQRLPVFASLDDGSAGLVVTDRRQQRCFAVRRGHQRVRGPRGRQPEVRERRHPPLALLRCPGGSPGAGCRRPVPPR